MRDRSASAPRGSVTVSYRGKANASASASTREFRYSGGFIRVVIQPGPTKADGSELLCRALDEALIRLSPE